MPERIFPRPGPGPPLCIRDRSGNKDPAALFDPDAHQTRKKQPHARADRPDVRRKDHTRREDRLSGLFCLRRLQGCEGGQPFSRRPRSPNRRTQISRGRRLGGGFRRAHRQAPRSRKRDHDPRKERHGADLCRQHRLRPGTARGRVFPRQLPASRRGDRFGRKDFHQGDVPRGPV